VQILNFIFEMSDAHRREGTSVSGGQLNDDDHHFHLSELYLKKYACALKCTVRVVAGNLIKDNKALFKGLYYLFIIYLLFIY